MCDRREIKWAVAGFVGGFLFCYVLLAVFRTPPTPPALAKATPVAAWPPAPVRPAFVITSPPSEFLPRRVEPRQLGGPRPGYSLDLIDDTHHEEPQPVEIK